MLVWDGELGAVAKQWQSRGAKERNIWPLEFSAPLTVLKKQQ